MAKERTEWSLDEAMESPHEDVDEKEPSILPTANNMAMERSEIISEDSSKCAPSSTICRATSNHDSRASVISSLDHNSAPLFGQNPNTSNDVGAPMELPELAPLFQTPIKHNRMNYSANLIPLLLTDSSCSMPSSPDPNSEKEEVQSRCRLTEWMQQQDNIGLSQPQPLFGLDLEGWQSPFPQLDQMRASPDNDPFQAYIASLTAPGYLQRSY